MYIFRYALKVALKFHFLQIREWSDGLINGKLSEIQSFFCHILALFLQKTTLCWSEMKNLKIFSFFSEFSLKYYISVKFDCFPNIKGNFVLPICRQWSYLGQIAEKKNFLQKIRFSQCLKKPQLGLQTIKSKDILQQPRKCRFSILVSIFAEKKLQQIYVFVKTFFC